MIHGLLWFPLLMVFIGLAWAGWNEYQKLEAYRLWAANFDRAKYDIYAVLGQKDRTLTWGKPCRSGVINEQTFSLDQVQDLRLLVDDRPIDPLHPPEKGRTIALEFHLPDRLIQIPFTEVAIAARWGVFLQHERQRGSHC